MCMHVCLYPGVSVPRCVCTPVCLYAGVSVPRCVCTSVCLYPGVSALPPTVHDSHLTRRDGEIGTARVLQSGADVHEVDGDPV